MWLGSRELLSEKKLSASVPSKVVGQNGSGGGGCSGFFHEQGRASKSPGVAMGGRLGWAGGLSQRGWACSEL